MKYLIIDTETSGLFDFKQPADAPGQPRLCGITMIAVDGDGSVESEFTMLIKPNGWTISPEITAINGLTTEECEAKGAPVETVLQEYGAFIAQGYVVVAYNAQFDTKVMRGEMRRAEMPDLFEATPNICVMRACHKLKVPKANGRGGYPSLSDSFRHLFGFDPPETHRCLPDAISCLTIFGRLQSMNALPAPEIHYAKNRPEAAA